MSVILEVTHLPSGQVWESGRYPEEKYATLRNMVEAAATLTFTHPVHGVYIIPAGVLAQSVIRLRFAQ